MSRPACFKAYDIRGRVPEDLDESLATSIGAAFAEVENARRVVVCRDVRLSSDAITDAVCDGLTAMGCEVLDVGIGGTEHMYFAVPHLDADGGIMVTASHNPANYNGMKLVRAGAVPISGDSGLFAIGELAGSGFRAPSGQRDSRHGVDIMDAYIDCLLEQVRGVELRPLKIVTNAGNGTAGLVIDRLERHLPFEFIRLQHEPDGTFPNGVPNPLLPGNRKVTSDAVIETSSDMGIAWDGDFDRCFFFDHTGQFVEGYYIVGLLAQYFLERATRHNEKIIHDPRLTWNTQEIVHARGGKPIMSKTGHAFIKERMRKEDALYGGEMSAHHYFRDFNYCDSGMIPWLLVASLLSSTRTSLSDLVSERQSLYPISGEINRHVADVGEALARVKERFSPHAVGIDFVDGLSMEFSEWRFNLRGSNTEPLLRLNVESRGNANLVAVKKDELLACL